MLLRLLVVVDAHEEYVTGVVGYLRGIILRLIWSMVVFCIISLLFIILFHAIRHISLLSVPNSLVICLSTIPLRDMGQRVTYS